MTPPSLQLAVYNSVVPLSNVIYPIRPQPLLFNLSLLLSSIPATYQPLTSKIYNLHVISNHTPPSLPPSKLFGIMPTSKNIFDYTTKLRLGNKSMNRTTRPFVRWSEITSPQWQYQPSNAMKMARHPEQSTVLSYSVTWICMSGPKATALL